MSAKAGESSLKRHPESRAKSGRRKSESTDEEVPKHNNLSIFGSWDLFVQLGSPSARREEPGCFVFSNHVSRDIRLSEDERRQTSYSLCLNQITDAGIHISDIFVVGSDFAIFVTPGATGRTSIFSWWSVLRTFNNRLNWETSRDKFFSRHGSRGAFDSSHLINSVTGTKK
jgi:hypothetical protein